VANVRDKIRLSPEEIREYLAASMTVIVGSINHDGYPHLVPMWYSMLDGRIHMHTYRSSQKVRNLERNPRGSALVEDGETYDKLRGVFMRGSFEIIDDPELCYRIGVANAAKYTGATEEQAGEFVRRQVRKRVALVFSPEKTSSWDHRKIV
jgi:PPOX class probable F420-dependent enzyme